MKAFTAIAPIFAGLLTAVSPATAQDNSLPGLTRRAVAACESVLSSSATFAGQAGLEGFVPFTVPGTLEAVGRGFASGDQEVYVKIMRSADACVIMVRDTVRHDGGRAIDAWSAASGVALAARPDGSRWARRGAFDYHHSIQRGDINVLAVRRP